MGKMHTTPMPAVNNYALRLIQKSESRQNPPPMAGPIEDWIGTEEFADLADYSPREIRRLCYEGFFVLNVDWKQRPPKPGAPNPQGGRIRLRRAALKKLEGS